MHHVLPHGMDEMFQRTNSRPIPLVLPSFGSFSTEGLKKAMPPTSGHQLGLGRRSRIATRGTFTIDGLPGWAFWDISYCVSILYIYIAENDPLLGNQRAPFSEHERSPCGVTCGFTTDYNLSFEDSAKAYILRGFIVFHQQLNLLRSHLGSFACLSFFEAARCAAARVTHSAALLLF